jgi:hypothetical protein
MAANWIDSGIVSIRVQAFFSPFMMQSAYQERNVTRVAFIARIPALTRQKARLAVRLAGFCLS